jgi:hypothetical protein
MTARGRHLVFGVLAICAFITAYWGWTPSDFSNPECKLTQNAAWIGVDWTSRPVDKADVERLADGATQRSIRYLFPYVTYLRADGTFSQSYDHAAEFVGTLRARDDSIKVLAWIGLPLRNPRPIGVDGWVDLSEPTTRKTVVDFVGDLVERARFDGVHINAETVQNNDPDFLLLLDEMRERLGEHRAISIAGSQWVPDLVNAIPPIHDFRWTSAYYRAVGKRVDQVAAMTYDSYMPLGTLYRLWMREQVRGISHSLEGTRAELLAAVSVSKEATWSHRPYAESLESGLAGMCAGMAGGGNVRGVAVYADWEFSESDGRVWRTWQQ